MTYDDLKALIEQRGVHAEFGAAGEGWAIEQNPHELATFLVEMLSLGVQSCLEIGTGYKGGLSRFLAAELGWKVTSVDVEDYGHNFAGVTYRTLEQLDNETVNGSFDLVFIDGNHNYKGVKHDYSYWGECAVKVIAFHDVAGFRGCRGVTEFWIELIFEGGHEVHEVIENSERKAGIGWLVL